MLWYRMLRDALIIIIVITIILVIGYFMFAKPVYEEYERLGYKSGETAIIDPMTGNIIPKNEIDTYNNDRVELITDYGEIVHLGEIKLILENMKNSIGGSGQIKDKKTLKEKCDILFTKYLSVEYEIKDNQLIIDGVWCSGDIDLESKVNNLVRKHLEEQNNK